MDDIKSTSCYNQAEKCKRDFQFSENMNERGNHSRMKQYKRDFLLQLRLHPLSLRKPCLPEVEIVKETLYLHNIVDSSSSTDKCMDLSNYQTSLKSDYCNMKHEYSLLPHYFNRYYPYCYPPHMYNGPFPSASSKYRSPFHPYCNPLKKHCMASHACYKEFPEECLWAKRCFASCEDMWNCYPSHVTPNFTKKKESLESIPKSRKKLSIIDPVTGKNILENETERQSDINTGEENSEDSENYNSDFNAEEKDFLCSNLGDGETSMPVSNEVYQDDGLCSSGDKNLKKMRGIDQMYQPEFLDKTIELSSDFEENSVNKHDLAIDSSLDENSRNNLKGEFKTSSPKEETELRESKNYKNLPEPLDTIKLFNKQERKSLQNKDIHGNCQPQNRKETNLHSSKENALKQNDSVRDGLKQLREKIYSLRQEQQKMAILQSFLRYKKYQLEETARNLDEKRIEIANWECSLFDKAKKLHDKELWLDSRSENLYNKAQELAEKEKMLSKDDSKPSWDPQNARNGPKEIHFAEKKYLFDDEADTVWDEMPIKVKNMYRDEENNEFPYFTGSSNRNNKTAENSLNVEKCKSEVCSLDELEKNIVFMEKMNSNEGGDTSLENKAEFVPSNSGQKKDDSSSRDPLGYSKGRRYLPDHLKYWLNKRDK